MTLTTGYYINIFPVELYKDSIKILIAEREKFTDLRPLREEIISVKKDVFVYADGNNVYGYGSDLDWLSSKGFYYTEVHLKDVPYLTKRMILEGFINELRDKKGYSPLWGKGRCQVFKWGDPKETSDGKVKVFKGFDLRSFFLWNHEIDGFVFNLVVDITYAIKNKDNNPLNFHEIVINYGSQILKEVRQIQGDLIPTGINTEISRQRFIEEILPFVKNFPSFQLPCGINAKLKSEPLRIILGSEDENLW